MENTINPANGTNGAPQNGMPQNDAPKNSATTTVSGIPAYLCYGGFALGLVLLLLTFFVKKWSTGVLFALALIAIIACIVGREMTKEYKDFSGRKLAKIGIILAIIALPVGIANTTMTEQREKLDASHEAAQQMNSSAANDTESSESKETGTETSEPAQTAEQTTEAATEEPTAEETTATNAPTTSSEDFRAMMDSYEAFMDQYIAFMQKYSTSDNPASMLQDYSTMMSQYADWATKMQAVDENSLSAEDWQYYVEVTTRISQKLAAAGVSAN